MTEFIKMDDLINITFLTGVKELKPVEYKVNSYTEGPWWWRRTLWAIESDYMRLSNIASKAEAEAFANMLRR